MRWREEGHTGLPRLELCHRIVLRFFFILALKGCEKLLHTIRKHGLLWLNMSLWFL